MPCALAPHRAYDASMVKCTYYLDVLSQWCYIAEIAVRKLLVAHGSDLEMSYLLVPLDRDVLPSRDEQLRVYRRSRLISGIDTTAWIANDAQPNTWDANAATLAASMMGVDFYAVRARIGEAALLRGMPLGDPGEAFAFVSREFELDPLRLREVAQSPDVRTQLEKNRAAFIANGLHVRPSFVLRNGIGDHIVLGGQYDFGILNAAVQSLNVDEALYQSFEREAEAGVGEPASIARSTSSSGHRR